MEIKEEYSLRQRVFHSIREDILSGKYKQHEELKEVNIGQELGVSRTPVREALRQLELEGLVQIIPNKGAYVTGITAKDILDIYAVRSMLEGLCARWAAEYIAEESIQKLKENIELSEFYAERKNYAQMCKLDTDFHEILYDASESKILKHMLSNFHHYVERVRRVSYSIEGRAEKSNQEHRMIVDAIISKEPLQAEQLANKHVMSTIQNIDTYKIIDSMSIPIDK